MGYRTPNIDRRGCQALRLTPVGSKVAGENATKRTPSIRAAPVPLGTTAEPSVENKVEL